VNPLEYAKLVHLETNLSKLAKRMNAGNILTGKATGC